MKIRIGVVLSSLMVLLIAAPVFAGEESNAAAPDEQAMMEAWMKAATPGDMHKKLDVFVGSWTSITKSWMAPGAPPMESPGVSENEWILGGRFVAQKFEGTFMGQPFSGIGYTGYDNIKKTYIGTWMDNMGTVIMSSTGSMDKDGKSMTFKSKIDDPMSGKETDIKETISIVDADHHTFEMWGPGPDGKMFRMMEITYTRKK